MFDSPITLVLVFASFAVTFLVARMLSKGYRERRARREQEAALKSQSRQVRRRHERSSRGKGK